MKNKNYDTLQQQINNIFQYAKCNIATNIKENNISTISIIFHNKTSIDWLDNFENNLNEFMNLKIENFKIKFINFDFYDEFAFLFDLNRFSLKFNEIKFIKCKFSLLMASNSIKNKFIFERCEFNSFKFNNSNFTKTITFKNSKFNNYSTNQNNKFNNLEFENCEFKSFGLSNCEANRISIENCKFGHWQLNIDEISCESFWFSVNGKSEYDIEIKFEKCNIDNLRLYQSNHTIIKSIFFSNSTLSLFDFNKNIAYELGFYNTKCKNVNFKNSTFQEEFHFEKCEVKNFANFSNTKFINNAYFNNTTFESYADFHEAEFEAVACFYGAKFEKPMNFSSVIFKDFNKANFVNLNTEKIDINSIKNSIENYKKLETKIQWANNFRDSFRVIKHSLIEINNNLEASNFHKLELYAKEIELENKIPITNNIAKIDYCISKTTFIDYIVSITFYIPLLILNFTYYTLCIFLGICEIIKKDFTIFVDWLLLQIYRTTSEHHTNFTRILNFTVMIIAIYGFFIIYVKKQLILYPASMYIIAYTGFILGIITGSIAANRKLKTIYLSIGTSIWLILIILSYSIVLFKIEYAPIVSNSLMYILSFLFAFILFVNKNIVVTILTRTLSYAMLLFILYAEPSIIIPFSNLNSNLQNQYLQTKLSRATQSEIINLASIINPEFNATKNPNSSENLSISELNEYKKFIVENKEILKDSNATNEKFKQAIYADSSRDKTIKCISFIYAIILGLCLFSLQKTARRNSVVPS